MAMLAHLGDTIFISSSALLLTSVERVARYRYSVSFEKLGVIETSEQLFLQLVFRLILEEGVKQTLVELAQLWKLKNLAKNALFSENELQCTDIPGGKKMATG